MKINEKRSDNISNTGCVRSPMSSQGIPFSPESHDIEFTHRGAPPWYHPTMTGSDGSYYPDLEAGMVYQAPTNFSELASTGHPPASDITRGGPAFLPPPPQGFHCTCQSCTQGTTTMNDPSISSKNLSYPLPNADCLPPSQINRPLIDGRWSQDAYGPMHGSMNHLMPAGIPGPCIYHHYLIPPSDLSQAYYWGDQGMSSCWNGVPTQQGSQSMSSYTYPQVTYGGEQSFDYYMKEESNNERLKETNGSRWPDIVKPTPQRQVAVDEKGDVRGLPMKLMELTESDYDWRKEPYTRPSSPSGKA